MTRNTTIEERNELWYRTGPVPAEDRRLLQAIHRVVDAMVSPEGAMPVLSERFLPITSEVLVVAAAEPEVNGSMIVTVGVYPARVSLVVIEDWRAMLGKGDLAPVQPAPSTGIYRHRWARRNGKWMVEQSWRVLTSTTQ